MMIQYLGEVSICLIGWAFLYQMFLRSEPAFVLNWVFLLSAMLLSFVLPALNIPVWEAPGVVAGGSIVATVQEQPQAWTMTDWLLLIYFIGVAIMSIRLLWRLFRITRIFRRGAQTLSNAQQMPMSFFGCIYIPPHITGEERALILSHEQAHYHQGHTWDLLLCELTSVVLWFNPAVYFIRLWLEEVHEYSADQAVFRNITVRPESYATLMRDLSKGNRPPLSHGFASFIKKRILMITQTPSVHYWKYAGILPLFAGMVCLFSFCSSPAKAGASAEPQYVVDTLIVFDPATNKEEMMIYRVPVSMANDFESASLGPGVGYTADTVVVYDKDTYEKIMTKITINELKKQ